MRLGRQPYLLSHQGAAVSLSSKNTVLMPLCCQLAGAVPLQYTIAHLLQPLLGWQARTCTEMQANSRGGGGWCA